MHRSAAREDHIAYSLSAEAEEPNLFTMHALRLRREREEAAGTALLEPPAEADAPAEPAYELTLVHGDEPLDEEPAETPVCPPNAAAILRDGWPWVDETAEAVDILLRGTDPATLLNAEADPMDNRENEDSSSPLFAADDRSATQDILLTDPAHGGDMEDRTMSQAATTTADETHIPETDRAQDDLGTMSDLTYETKPAGGSESENGDTYVEVAALGEPVIDDASVASLCAAIGQRPEVEQNDTAADNTREKARPEPVQKKATQPQREPMPTLPERGSIARLGERRLKAVPRRIGKGKLVPARLTWKPGDPFAEPKRAPRPRFRWDVMLTAACLTAVSGMGCAWLLRTIFV